MLASWSCRKRPNQEALKKRLTIKQDIDNMEQMIFHKKWISTWLFVAYIFFLQVSFVIKKKKPYPYLFNICDAQRATQIDVKVKIFKNHEATQ